MMRAGRGQEALGRVLGVDAALDRVAAAHDVVLGERQRLAARDPDLLGDEVELRDHLGDAVLDLEPGVHLEEAELAVLVEHLDGAGVHVAASTARPSPRPRPSRGACRRSSPARGRLLDQLLVAALRRAVALAEPHRVAVRVGEDLDLDVARAGEVALEVASERPKYACASRVADSSADCALVGVVDDLHALAAAAVRGLDRDRPAELLAERDDVVGAR